MTAKKDFGRVMSMLNILFLLLVVATFVTYFLMKDEHPVIFIIIGFAAIALRLGTYIWRHFKRQ